MKEMAIDRRLANITG